MNPQADSCRNDRRIAGTFRSPRAIGRKEFVNRHLPTGRRAEGQRRLKVALHVGFTLIELLVVVAIIALLIAILLPSLTRAREHAKAAVCAGNLRQMGVAMEMYLEDNEGFYPGEHSARSNPALGGGCFVTWAPRLRLYASMNEELFWCPTADEETYWKIIFGVPRIPAYVRGYGYQPTEKPLIAGDPGDLFCYGYNSWGVAEWVMNESGVSLGLGAHVDDWTLPWAWRVRADDVRRPAEMIAIADNKADGNWDSAIDPENWQDHEWPSSRHSGGAEVLFCDGHVIHELQLKLVEPTDWARRRWNNDFLPHEDVWQDDDPWGG
jgi:prepilin-type N-terminal cleavage/methylation domain-containing protein/prepilin-type processing-associated H-X9-DG protein